jgi:hypothetical protein
VFLVLPELSEKVSALVAPLADLSVFVDVLVHLPQVVNLLPHESFLDPLLEQALQVERLPPLGLGLLAALGFELAGLLEPGQLKTLWHRVEALVQRGTQHAQGLLLVQLVHLRGYALLLAGVDLVQEIHRLLLALDRFNTAKPGILLPL